MFVTTAYRTLLCEEKKKTNCSFEKIEVPPLKSQNKAMNYSKLGPDGIVKKGLPVYKGDIIVGKTLTKVQKDEQEEKMDFSLAIASGEEGIVDEIWSGPGEDGYLMVKVKIRQMRIPEVGDKCASRSSQKGVCGLLLPQEDMPFTSQGITPDLLMNPHSMPSRMTLSQLTECLYGKLSSLNGKFGDATAFTDQSINPVEGISSLLKAYGFQRYGNEKLFNGFTGEFLDSELFIGPTYYQRLKHMVGDKIHSRSTGNVTMMHHQPSEGRSREGGLRVGEMERDALISHGGAAFIQETLFDMSDAYQVNVCEQCGNILSSATACRMCKTGQVNRTNIPYCAKLLFQELEAMGIKIQINTK